MHTVRRQVSSSSIDEFTFVTAETALNHIVECFSDWLTEYIANGAMISDGETLQYGFTLLYCRVESRRLTLLAPDFRNMPIRWVTDLGAAFRIVAMHKYTPETFGFTPDIPSLRNTAMIGQRFDELPMFADRVPPVDSNPNDSGWFVGRHSGDVDNNDPDNLQLMSLYELVLAVPQVLQFLSLPIGCQVLFSGGTPNILIDYEELQIPKDSYLDQQFNSQ